MPSICNVWTLGLVIHLIGLGTSVAKIPCLVIAVRVTVLGYGICKLQGDLEYDLFRKMVPFLEDNGNGKKYHHPRDLVGLEPWPCDSAAPVRFSLIHGNRSS